MKEFCLILLRWFLSILTFCCVYMALALATAVAEHLAPINAQRYMYYLLGMFTLAFVERISKE